MVGVAGVDIVRLAVLTQDDQVGIFLAPGDGSLGAIGLDGDVVLMAMCDLRGGDGGQPSVLQLDYGRSIVIELATFGEYLQGPGNLIGENPADKSTEVVGVLADVPETSGRATLVRIGSPGGQLLVLELEPGAKPALDVGGLDISKLTGLDHLPGLAHQWVAGVIMSDGEDDLVLLDKACQLLLSGPGRRSLDCHRRR